MRYLLASVLLILTFVWSTTAWGSEPVEVTQEWRWIETTFGEMTLTIYKPVTVVSKGDKVISIIEGTLPVNINIDSSSDD